MIIKHCSASQSIVRPATDTTKQTALADRASQTLTNVERARASVTAVPARHPRGGWTERNQRLTAEVRTLKK